MTQKIKNKILPDKVYNVLYYLCLYVLPASATLYSVLGSLWGWAYVTEIVGTIVAIDTFLGACIDVKVKKGE